MSTPDLSIIRRVDALEVRWPSGKQTAVSSVAANRRIELREGGDGLTMASTETAAAPASGMDGQQRGQHAVVPQERRWQAQQRVPTTATAGGGAPLLPHE